MKICILTALAVASMVGQLLAGDLKITSKSEEKIMLMSQKSDTVQYCSARYVRTNNEKGQKDLLVDYKDLTSYQIDHKNKTISIFTLDDMLKLTEMMNNRIQTASPEKKKKMEKMFGGSPDDIAKTEQLGTEIVAGRVCNKWRITIGKGNVYAVSADPTLELPIPKADLEKGDKLMDSNIMILAGVAPTLSKLQEERAKIKGFPLKMNSQMVLGPFTLKIKQEVTKIEEGPIPESIFELPKGYKTEDVGKKMLEKMIEETNNPDKGTKKK